MAFPSRTADAHVRTLEAGDVTMSADPQPLPDSLKVEDNDDDAEVDPVGTKLTHSYVTPIPLRKTVHDLVVTKDTMKLCLKELHASLGRAFEDDDQDALTDWYDGWKELSEVLDQTADLSLEVRRLQALRAVRRAKYKNVVALFNRLVRENCDLRAQVLDLEERLSVCDSCIDMSDERPMVAAQLSSFQLWAKLDAICTDLGKSCPDDEPRGQTDRIFVAFLAMRR